VRNDEPHLRGIQANSCQQWESRELNCYIDIQTDIHSVVNKHMIVVDPSTYGGEETNVGVLWSWEKNAASIGLVQVVSQYKHLTEDEFDMSDSVQALRHKRKLERVAALRQWQSTSAMMRSAVGCYLEGVLIWLLVPLL